MKHWYVVYTRSRHEKDVAEDFEDAGLEFYLPATVKERRWKDRRSKVEIPLFPGYIFLREDFTGEEGWARKMTALSPRGAVKLICAPSGDPIPVPDKEIENIRTVLEKDMRVDPHRYDFHPGQALRIRKGPLSGVEGIVVRRKGVYKLILQVHLLCQAVAVTIAASDVEAPG